MRFRPEVLSTRFGYGLPLPQGTPDTPEAMLALLQGPDLARAAYPLPLMAQHLPMIQNAITVRQMEKQSGAKDNKGFKTALQALNDQSFLAMRTTVARALDTPDGFRERLVAFWTNHFCTTAKDNVSVYLPALMVEEAIRPNLAGRFADLLIAATTHPAMVLYLDQNTSYGPNSPEATKRRRGLNENLGREVMELHSLGVEANYTQDDVRQMALLLTGLTFLPMHDGATFDPNRVEPGTRTVLGRDYPGKGMARIRNALTDLARRPETAHHISLKLARHFIADTPPEPLVKAMTAAYRQTGGDLMAVYRVLLTDPAAAGSGSDKIRWPNDYLITGLRALGLSGSDIMAMKEGPFRRAVLRPAGSMGMPWFKPAGPNGFPEAAEDWINPPFLAARIAWAMTVPNTALGTKDMMGTARDPRVLIDTVLGTRVTPPLRLAVSRAESRMQGLGLILASTEMNRR